MFELKDKHKGQPVWFIGKGPSLRFLLAEDIGDGIIISLNQAIITIESLFLPNIIYSMQKDGGHRRRYTTSNLSPICDYCNECEDSCPPVVRPKRAILLLHDLESKFCFLNYPERYVLNLGELGLDRNVFSLIFAVKTAQYMGCNKFYFASFDAITNGDQRSYIPGEGVVQNVLYGNQMDQLAPHIEGYDCEWITPTEYPRNRE